MGNDLLDLIMGGGGGSPPISAANHQPVAAAPTSIGGGGLDDLLATPTHGKSLVILPANSLHHLPDLLRGEDKPIGVVKVYPRMIGIRLSIRFRDSELANGVAAASHWIA